MVHFIDNCIPNTGIRQFLCVILFENVAKDVATSRYLGATHLSGVTMNIDLVKMLMDASADNMTVELDERKRTRNQRIADGIDSHEHNKVLACVGGLI